jgi:hypothetical protein
MNPPHSSIETIIQHTQATLQNSKYHHLKPHKIPGLRIRAILENPAKCPDPIGAIIRPKTAIRAHSGFFKTGVLCPDNNRLSQMADEQKRCLPNLIKVHQKAL